MHTALGETILKARKVHLLCYLSILIALFFLPSCKSTDETKSVSAKTAETQSTGVKEGQSKGLPEDSGSITDETYKKADAAYGYTKETASDAYEYTKEGAHKAVEGTKETASDAYEYTEEKADAAKKAVQGENSPAK